MLRFRYQDKPIETSCEFLTSVRPSEWLCQKKYDGWRGGLYTDESRVANFLSSSGKSMNKVSNIPPGLAKQISDFAAQLPPNSVVDSEFVGPRGGHVPRIFMFDVLAWDGEWQTTVPYQERWNRLVSEFTRQTVYSHIHLADTVEEGFLEIFEELKNNWDRLVSQGRGKQDLYEGVIMKRRSGTLTLNLNSSSKSHHSMKIKYREIQERRFW